MTVVAVAMCALVGAGCGGSAVNPVIPPAARTATSIYSQDSDACRLVSRADATQLFGTTASPWSLHQPPIMRGMHYCLWKGHSTHGAVQGNIDYNLIVGVVKYSTLGHFIAAALPADRSDLAGVGEKAIFERLSDTAIAVEFVKNGRLVVLYDGVGPYNAQNLDKALTQRLALIALARLAATRA